MTEFLQSSFAHFQNALFLGFLPTIVICAITFITVLVLAQQLDLAKFSLVFSTTGCVLGLMLGASREPAVNAFLPAIITIIGTLVVFTFPKTDGMRLLMNKNDRDADQPEYKRKFVLTAIAALMLSAVMGSFWGGSIRGLKEQDDLRYQEWKTRFEQLEIPAMRQQLGLEQAKKK